MDIVSFFKKFLFKLHFLYEGADCNTVFQFDGDLWHGHSLSDDCLRPWGPCCRGGGNGKWTEDDVRKKYEETQKVDAYLRNQLLNDSVRIEKMAECHWIQKVLPSVAPDFMQPAGHHGRPRALST